MYARDATKPPWKEGVDGSSPLEGLHKSPPMASCVACDGEISTLRGYETGTFSDWRALAGTRDVSRHSWDVLEKLEREHSLEKFLQRGPSRCPRWRDVDSPLR
jgi:hypothetical protein